VLVKSGFLNDADLIEVIRSHTLEHALAVAARPTLSPSVTDALVATDAEDVIVEVLKNQGSQFAPKTMAHLVEKSRQSRPLREPILMRREMTPELALRMFLWVTAALREGDVNTFISLFGRMSDLKAHVIDRFLFDPTGRGLAIA